MLARQPWVRRPVTLAGPRRLLLRITNSDYSLWRGQLVIGGGREVRDGTQETLSHVVEGSGPPLLLDSWVGRHHRRLATPPATSYAPFPGHHG
jgi:hypothetical protein